MQITTHQYGTLFNTPVELPADVRATIFSHLTLAEAEVASKAHRAAYRNFNLFKHVPVITLFKKHFEYLNLNISPLITEHPFQPEVLQNLATCRDFNTTKEFISGWLREVYDWSKKEENCVQAATFAKFYLPKSKVFTPNLLRKIMFGNEFASKANLNDIFYAVFAKKDLLSDLDKKNQAYTINNHPLLRSTTHCKRLLRDLTYIREKGARARIANFITIYPLAEYIQKGLITSQDVPCDFVKLEIGRILVDKVDFQVDEGCFNRLPEDLKMLFLKSTSLQCEETKSSKLNKELEILRKISLELDAELEKLRQAPKGHYKLKKILQQIVVILPIAYSILMTFGVLKYDTNRTPLHLVIQVTVHIMVGVTALRIIKYWIERNRRLEKEQMLFLKK